MKTNLTNSGRVILSNPEKGMDSFFVAVGKFFIKEYASLEPSDVVTQMWCVSPITCHATDLNLQR